MTKKMTKRDYFNQILANYNLTDEEQKFIKHELELLANKAEKAKGTEKGMTSTQKENLIHKTKIAEILGAEPNRMWTASEVLKAMPEITSNQKMSALLNQMVDTGEVVKTSEKRKSYFQIKGAE